jgi:hypothetical protein
LILLYWQLIIGHYSYGREQPKRVLQKLQSSVLFIQLHPMDAYEYSLRVQGQLEEFVNAFKERIEVEIDYSKALFKVSKILSRHVQPDLPTPMSYVCSAFKVENEQRARHSL